MKLTAMRAATLLLLLLLLLLCSSGGGAEQSAAAVRQYYIAAVEIGWDYVYLDDVDPPSDQRGRAKDIPQKYVKAVYREYTDSKYTVPKPRPPWTGIQGPVIVARAGDRVVIHFKNLASQSYSISPVGITYWKQSEGAGYDDSTAGQEKDDDAVSPGGYYEYVWDISPKDGPTASDPECLTYSYSSQVDTVRDVNSGLIGALLICKTSAFTDDGQRRNPAFVLLFAVFDETKSWYGEVGEMMSREKFKRSTGRKEYHTINGYVNSTLPGLTMCQGRNHVFWHLIGMGTAPEIHSIQFQDHTLQVMTHRKVTMEVTPMTFITAEMRPATIGHFLMSCQIHAHRHDGMNAFFTVEKCPEPVAPPGPDLRHVKHEDYGDSGEDYNDEDEDLFNTISYQPMKPKFQARASRGQPSRIWEHYIAIEEVNWDYASHLKPTDSELQSGYLPAAPHHLGYKYKKAAYVEYTDGSFTQRKNAANTLLGPLLKGKINDQIYITLRNLASRPFNIYPNGLTKIFPLQSSANDAEKDLHSMGVPPNGTFSYIWSLTTEDGPLEGDPQCLTQLYQSTVSPERDLASGLVGTLLICKHNTMDDNGRLLGPDKEWSLIFAVFDENRSWYFNENMQKSSQKSLNTTEPDFYNSNVIYSINGVMFGGRRFVVSQNDVAFWHVANVGTQSDFLSVYFTGNLFQYQGHYKSVLTLFPMTGMTVPMETELIGEWEISAYDGRLKNRGMGVHYTVLHSDDGYRVDRDGVEDDISDYIDQIDLQPRGKRPENRTMLVKVCKKHLADNNTQSVNTSECQLKKVTVDEEGGIPQDILEEIERDEEWTEHVSGNGTKPGGERTVSHNGTEPGGEQTVSHNGTEPGGERTVSHNGIEPGGESTVSHNGAEPGGERTVSHNGTEPGGERTVSHNGTEPGGEQTVSHNGIEPGGERTVSHNGTEPGGERTISHNGTEPGGERTVSHNGTEPGGERTGEGGGRQRRQAEGCCTDVDGATEDGGTGMEIEEEAVDKAGAEEEAGERGEMSNVGNGTKRELEESNEILLNSSPQLNEKILNAVLSHSEEMDRNLISQNHIQSEPERLTADLLDLKYNYTAVDNNNDTTGIDLSLKYDDYDDYSQEGNGTSDIFATDYMDLRSGETRYHHYYIAAEEITWDYGIRKPHQLLKPREMRRGMRKFLPEYKKVVFRAYSDKDFLLPVGRGEPQEHLGIMGPFIRAEINDLLTVVFKNKASRPYSFHLQGVYDRSQGAGFGQTHALSAPPGVPGEPVAPGEARTYNWRVTKKQGPTDTEFDCKTGAYYSTVDKERDLHSGLIGPLVICKPGTLQTRQNTQRDVQEFALLFHTFDETKSWYLQENLRQYCAPPCQANTEDPWYHTSNKFAAINGYVAETLPGLLIAQHQLVRWHLLNVGSDGEYHAVHFHGLPFTVHTEKQHRMGVYNLFPGVFGTVEMTPPRVGTWLVECTIGEYQLAGMRAKLLVYNPRCVTPLGMKSGRIEDSQITASDHIGNWVPRLARLDQTGYINAWIGRNQMSWLQVDLQRPTLLHGVQTQGVRSRLRDNYIAIFNVSYSLDQETWTTYRGNRTKRKVFYGNMDSSKVKTNTFSPPFVARYIKIQPVNFVQTPALRLELLGCDLNSCSLPLGLQKRLIPDTSFSASSFYSSLLRSWSPSLARLHQEGSANAWRPKNNNPHEWLQVDLGNLRRITGVVIQGARSLLTQMMVTEFSVTFSHDGHSWSSVLEPSSQREQIFTGNNDSDNEALTLFDPPLFGQYLRIHPRGWINHIALRLEVLGCDTQRGL